MKHIITILCSISISSSAATYHVSKAGNDSNPGTSGSPWLTIQKAANTMSAGDTAIVNAGTYTETVTTGAAGSAGNPIVFLGTNNPVVKGWVIDHQQNEVRGFTILGTALTFAVRVNAAGHNTRVADCIFTNTTARGVGIYYSAPYASNLWLEANRFIDCGDMSVSLLGLGHVVTNNWFTTSKGYDALVVQGSNIQIVGNTFTNWVGDLGIHTDIIQVFNIPPNNVVSTNVVFERNLVINCPLTQIGMVEDQENLGNVRDWTFRNNLYVDVDGSLNIYAHNFSFYNNTYIRSGNSSGSPLLFRSGGDGKGDALNGRVFNNIFFECGSNPADEAAGWYGVEAECTNSFTADYNLVIGTGAGTTKSSLFVQNGWEGAGLNGQNPLFVSASDFRLQAASPCLAAGTNLNAIFTTDFASVIRGASWDIGAYEYVPPSGLTLTTTTLNTTTLVIGQ